jgi:hypothetical protein
MDKRRLNQLELFNDILFRYSIIYNGSFPDIWALSVFIFSMYNTPSDIWVVSLSNPTGRIFKFDSLTTYING